MKRLLSITLFALLACAGENATAQQRICGSHDYLMQQLAQNPEMAAKRQALEVLTQELSQPGQANKTTTAIYTVPVVVHVLYNNSTSNISDAQILSQITVLNQDFQKLNSDASQTPSVWQGIAADAQVQFCMAQRDPQGNATNGIVRKSTTKSTFSYNTDDAKSSSTGGDDPWPAGQYLNIWVVPAINGGTLGYAQFPGGPASTDGVVIAHIYFGNTGTASAPFNLGRTATHEVGHWLNLYHIWGDDGTSCSGSDLVGDTPNQGDENYGCPSFPTTSCSNGPNGDMYMNYMDYTDDACMYMFTAGQKTRMHAVFASGGPRNSITTSLGCQPPAAVCNAPTGLNAASIANTSANLSWSAVSGATAYNVQWKLTSSGTWNTISNVTTNSKTLTGLTANNNYSYQIQTICASGSSAYSTPANFTTTNVASGCQIPNGLVATNITTSSATLNWNTVATAVTYTLQWKLGTATSWTTVSGISGTSYNLTGLNPKTNYKWNVKSVCASGGSNFASNANFNTLALACAIPGSLSSTPSTTGATLTWGAVSGAQTYILQWKPQGGTTWTTISGITSNSYALTGLNQSATYEWRVRTKCNQYDQSAVSVSDFFSTTGVCTDIFEPNNVKTEAKKINANIDVFAMIGTATDEDWLKVMNTSNAWNIKVTLKNLPADYDVYLYKGSVLMGASTNTGTADETIVLNTTSVATYLVKVVGKNGAFSTAQCYKLKAELSNVSFRTAEGSATEAMEQEDLLSVYPNPASTSITLNYKAGVSGNAQVYMVDQAGRVCMSQPLSLETGENIATLDISGLANGLYFVRLVSEGGAYTTKILVQR